MILAGMSTTDIIAIIVTVLGVASFAAVVTILFRNYIKSSIKETRNGDRDIELVDDLVYSNDKGVIKRRRAASIGKNIAYYSFLAVLIPLFGLSLYSRIKNNVTQFGDNAILVVASGSMSVKLESNDYLYTNNLNNQFNTYDLITVRTAHSTAELRRYDVIAYRNDKGMNVIHRIIDVDTSGSEIRYVTRGDANAASDSYRPKFSDVIGKYTNKRIPGIGVFVMFFQSYAGIVTIVSVVYCTIMISHFRKKLDDATDERQEMLATVFDVNTMGLDDSDLMTSTHENTIFFKGVAYHFDEEHLLEKRDMSEEETKRHEERLKEMEEEEQKSKKKHKQEEK